MQLHGLKLNTHYPKKWDMSVIEDISAEGLMFMAPSDLPLNDKIVQLKIKIQELAPRIMEVNARVVNVKPCFNFKGLFNPKICEVRVEFINISRENEGYLSALVEKMRQKGV